VHARRPHVKLLLLHLFFYLPLRAAVRRNGNYWLAFFGKWTLADVLVMCVLVGLLNLTASLDLPEAWRQLEPAFDGACATACAKLPPADDAAALSAAWGDATTPSAAVDEAQQPPLWAAIASGASLASPASPTAARNCSAWCGGLAAALDRTLTSPDELPSSSIEMHLRLEGLNAMYFFCVAVVLSLSTSVLVEYLDDRARHRHDAADGLQQPMLFLDADADADAHAHVHAHAHAHSTHGGEAASVQSAAAALSAALSAAAEAEAEAEAGAGAGEAKGRRLACVRPREGALHVVLVVLQLAAVGAAFSTPMFARRMQGSLCELLKVHGFDFGGEYSLVQLGLLAGQAGGWDYLMATTFWVFVIVCPLLRGASLLVLLLWPLSHAAALRLHRASRYASYYFALEVLLLAVPLIHNAMGPMTANLLSIANFPACKHLNVIYPNPPGVPHDLCFEISVEPLQGYWLTLAAVAIFLLSGFDGSPTHKYIHRLLEPADTPPPTCAVSARCR